MKFNVEIDSNDLLYRATRWDRQSFAKELLNDAVDEDIIDEVISRDLASEILDCLSEDELTTLLEPYGFTPKEE